MKITSFNPIYGTMNLNEAEEFFHALGFEVTHRFSQKDVEIRTLKNDAGLRIDILDSEYTRNAKVEGFFATRMNVDDLQETVDFFTNNGAKLLSPIFNEGDSRKVVIIQTKNGDVYAVIHHIK